MSGLREVTTGLRFPEGPVAMADGSVLLVEIARGTLTRVGPDGTRTIVATPGAGPNGAAIGPDGKCWICNNGGFKWHEEPGMLRPVLQAEDYSGGRIEKIDLATGRVERVFDRVGEHGLRGPNDLVFDAHGGVWFTDLGKGRARDLDRGGVYYGKADGSAVREVIYPMIMPNGIGLSPDGRTLYVAETEPGRLWAFDVTAPGEVRKDPWPSPHGGRLVVGLGGYQRCDSLAVQADGSICVATLMSGGISIVSPDGMDVRFVKMPEPYPTNICFGGKDLKTAYITLSTTGKLVAMDWPVPGLPLNYLNAGAAVAPAV